MLKSELGPEISQLFCFENHKRYLLACAFTLALLFVYCSLHGVVSADGVSGILISLGWAFDVFIFWFVAIPIISALALKINKVASGQRKVFLFCLTGSGIALCGLITQSLLWRLDSEQTVRLAFQFLPFSALIFTLVSFHAIYFLKSTSETQDPAQQPEKLAFDSHQQTSFLVSKGNREQVLTFEDIELVSSAGNYVEIISKGENYLYRSTLSSMVTLLKNRGFIQIHRQYLVRKSCLASVQNLSSQSPRVHLKNGLTLPVGKRFKQSLIDMRNISS